MRMYMINLRVRHHVMISVFVFLELYTCGHVSVVERTEFGGTCINVWAFMIKKCSVATPRSFEFPVCVVAVLPRVGQVERHPVVEPPTSHP